MTAKIETLGAKLPVSPDQFLESAYLSAMSVVGSSDSIKSTLRHHEKELLNIVLRYAEQAKGVLTVSMTSIIYKILHAEQDIRNHQTSIENGYSGRTFDTQFITPFMKAKKFPAMAESGWLTRSLEQKVPYNKQYPGAIHPTDLKIAFLEILDNLQNKANAVAYLEYLLQGLILQRNKHQINLAKPTALTISALLKLLDKHFNYKYKADGASRLPVLAIYSVYQALMTEMKRFQGKILLPIESHTSADGRSGRIGDIEVVDEKHRSFEAVEVKHGIAINVRIIQDAFKKFSKTPVDRYYILSTAEFNADELSVINLDIQRIKNIHGCQVIVNGILETLKYYLRLLENSYEFIENYVTLLEQDKALKFEHKDYWNKLVGLVDN